MSSSSSCRGMVDPDSKQAASVRQHRDGPRHKEIALLMPSLDPTGVRSVYVARPALHIAAITLSPREAV